MENELIKKHLKDLAEKSYKGNQFTFTDFLGMSETSEAYSCEQELRYAGMKIWGGYEDSERCMVRFGKPDELGYDEPFPIAVLCVKPLAEKFSDELTHRDFLGALMNIGIERSVLGDICITGNRAYILCLERMCDFICNELTRVKHTTVVVEKCSGMPEMTKQCPTEKRIQISSERADGVVSKLYNMSRSSASELFGQQKIFINGRICENSDYRLKPGDRVTVRGYGRFIFEKCDGLTKKGKINAVCLL